MDVLMSVKPKYVETIFNGFKRYEFRKTRFAKDVEYVFIYATAPVQKILGYFKVGCIQEGTPIEIWEKCEGRGISSEDFFAYFRNKGKAYAIEIKEVHIYPIGLCPKSLWNNFRAPQSYRYLNEEMDKQLKTWGQPIRLTDDPEDAGWYTLAGLVRENNLKYLLHNFKSEGHDVIVEPYEDTYIVKHRKRVG